MNHGQDGTESPEFNHDPTSTRYRFDYLVLIESAIKKWIWILRSEKEECTQRPAGFEADVTSAPMQASDTWQLEASHSTFDQ